MEINNPRAIKILQINGPFVRKGIGKSRTTSISKIRKMRASRKNRREKGVRAEPFGSKPHSYGEVFSRS